MKIFSMSKGRENHIDSTAGFLICYMILTHIFQFANMDDTPVYLWLRRFLFFFMPWFFFKAGMFYKPAPVSQVIKKSTGRLLLPFIIFSFIGHIIWCTDIATARKFSIREFFFTPISDVVTHTGAPQGNTPLWFLFSLFFVRILFCILQKKTPVWLISILAFGTAYILSFIHTDRFVYVMNISSGLAFCSAGYGFRHISQNRADQLIAPAIAIYTLIVILLPSYVDMRSNHLITGNYWIYCLSSVCGIFAINKLAQVKFLSKTSNKLKLSVIGRGSMIWFCLHWPLLLVVKIIALNIIGTNDTAYFIAMLATCTIFLPIFTRIPLLWVLTTDPCALIQKKTSKENV